MGIGIEREALLIATLVVLGAVFVSTLLLFRKTGGSGKVGRHPKQSARDEEILAELADLRRRVEQLEAASGLADETGENQGVAAYDYAVQYARQGMIAPEIAARCGISLDEATLIVAVHRKGREP